MIHLPGTAVRRYRLPGFALTLALLVAAVPVSAAPQSGTARQNEFKLIVTAVTADTLLKTLALERQLADAEVVYYFDTSDRMLQSHHVTLRARERVGDSGDSTVKLRAPASTIELGVDERSLAPELDWTNEHAPTEARSVTRKHIDRSLVGKVAAGLTPVAELFTDAQRQLVEKRLPDISWEDLKPFGPVHVDLWSRQTGLTGFAGSVTVELWHLQQADRRQEILEVSAKAHAETEAEAHALARRFFAAARGAGLGEPDGRTKTQLVLDFFKPGT